MFSLRVRASARRTATSGRTHATSPLRDTHRSWRRNHHRRRASRRAARLLETNTAATPSREPCAPCVGQPEVELAVVVPCGRRARTSSGQAATRGLSTRSFTTTSHPSKKSSVWPNASSKLELVRPPRRGATRSSPTPRGRPRPTGARSRRPPARRRRPLLRSFGDDGGDDLADEPTLARRPNTAAPRRVELEDRQRQRAMSRSAWVNTARTPGAAAASLTSTVNVRVPTSNARRSRTSARAAGL